MITETLKAWLIHKRWTGESSAIIYFYTQEYGMLVCRYRGCRTLKKQGAIVPFSSLWLTFQSKKDWHYVQSLELEQAPLPLDGVSLFSALYVNELLYYSSRALEQNAILFQQYIQTIKSLAQAKDKLSIEQSLRQFEWTLLKESGYEIPLDVDINGQIFKHSHYYELVPGEGLRESSQGVEGKYLWSLAKGESVDTVSLKALKLMMRKAITHMLDGKPLKTRALFAPSNLESRRETIKGDI